MAGRSALVQHFPHFSGQNIQGKRLLQKVRGILQQSIVCHRVGRVAGHEDRLDAGFYPLDLFRHFLAVHDGHHHVGEQQMNLAGIFLTKSKGFAGPIWSG